MRNAAIADAASALARGHLVAFPTETVFGLGADIGQPAAVAQIFAAKGRPSDHPLIVHVSSADLLDVLAVDVPAYARALAALWPGPLTLILHRSPLVADSVTGGQPTVGIRVPSHPVALELLREFEAIGGLGVAAPSANRFGKVSPTTAAAVREELAAFLGEADVVLDGEQSAFGIESTIVDCTGALPVILRPGAITAETVSAVAGSALGTANPSVRVSGSLESHYAPTATVLLAGTPEPGEGLIALAAHPTPAGAVRLAAPATAEDYAHDLYAALREADTRGLRRVVAIPPLGDGIAVAIRDRLQRASHGSGPHS